MERAEGMSSVAKMKGRQESSLQSAEGMQRPDGGVGQEQIWPLKLNYSVASCQQGIFPMMDGYGQGSNAGPRKCHRTLASEERRRSQPAPGAARTRRAPPSARLRRSSHSTPASSAAARGRALPVQDIGGRVQAQKPVVHGGRRRFPGLGRHLFLLRLLCWRRGRRRRRLLWLSRLTAWRRFPDPLGGRHLASVRGRGGGEAPPPPRPAPPPAWPTSGSSGPTIEAWGRGPGPEAWPGYLLLSRLWFQGALPDCRLSEAFGCFLTIDGISCCFLLWVTFLFLCFCFFFDARDGTRRLAHARHVLYHRAAPPVPSRPFFWTVLGV